MMRAAAFPAPRQLAAPAVDHDRPPAILRRRVGNIKRHRPAPERSRPPGTKMTAQPPEAAAPRSSSAGSSGPGFAHHPKIVSRREIGRPDVEFAVLIFLEAFRPGDVIARPHWCMDMAVVVDLDAAVSQQGQSANACKACAGMKLGKLARSSRALASVIDEILFSPRCGTITSILRPLRVLSASASKARSAIACEIRMQAGDGVVVELGEKRAQHLLDSERTVGFGK